MFQKYKGFASSATLTLQRPSHTDLVLSTSVDLTNLKADVLVEDIGLDGPVNKMPRDNPVYKPSRFMRKRKQ
jgi:hypothetical protein